MFMKNFDMRTKSANLIITTDNTATVNIYSPYTEVNKTVFVNQGVAHVVLPGSIGMLLLDLHQEEFILFLTNQSQLSD